MAKDLLEIYCEHCPSPNNSHSSGAYFFVSAEIIENCKYIFVCPNCKHEHVRIIKAGSLPMKEKRVEIHMSAWHKRALLSLITVKPVFAVKVRKVLDKS